MSQSFRTFNALAILAVSCAATCAAPAAACTVCDSVSAAQVRGAIIEGDFVTSMMAAALPTFVFAGVIGAAHFASTARRRQQNHLHERSESSR